MAIHLEKIINYDTEDSRTKEKCLCFEVCALCLSSTMESSKLYMWQIWWNFDDIQRPVVLGFAYLCTVGLASSSDHLSKLLAHYIVLVPQLHVLEKKLLVGCTIYLGIEDVYMEVVGKEMTWSISIPMSRDWKRDVIWFTSQELFY